MKLLLFLIALVPMTFAAKCDNNGQNKKCSTTTSTLPPKPTPTYCGSRGQPQCAGNQYCIADPANLGCSLIADCPGICVALDGPMCAGFAGFQCPDPAQVCIDDPRDSCDPGAGGADCSGICVYVDGRSGAVV